MPDRITMTTPLVELDGDEMTRVIWAWVKELVLEPFVALKTEYFDLGLAERERTNDQITVDAAAAIKRLGVGVKCATITPNAERVEEYGLSQMYPSPNGTIRALLDGTVFRAPIPAAGITPYVANWKKPITIARHAYGDIYRNTELRITDSFAGAKVELVATAPDGREQRALIHNFADATAGDTAGTAVGATATAGATAGTPAAATTAAATPEQGTTGIIQGIHNTDESIASFARACMDFALSSGQDLWFGTKDTISKTYARRFRDIFDEVYWGHYHPRFEEAGIEYFYTLIDDAVARVIRSEGGFIWACRNYDGDVMSDLVATAFGSLAMMTSVLVSHKGYYEYEAAHGTVQRHYYRHLAGEETSTNPVATLFAWTGALKRRAQLDGLPELGAFAKRLEAATLGTIEAGVMTGDLFALSSLPQKRRVDTKAFLGEVAARVAGI
ncbi:MAG: NADP-dependent isocitrate dehydrogenase [Coriobacteriales bacterium]|nr:NADP-dependent isocitrate dehydrogenase [Coriobacteriales bacterium]